MLRVERSWILSILLILLMIQGIAPSSSSSSTCEHECEEGFYFASCVDACIQCPPGHFCFGNGTAPVPCPVGTASSTSGASLSSVCQSCVAGHYAAVPGSASCLPCPSGYRCPSTSGLPIECNPGTFSPPGNTTCLPCPDGSFSSRGARQCELCTAGFYCPATDKAVQIACPPGSFSSPGSTTCTHCPAGSECPTQSGSENKICQAGFFSLGNATTCIRCPAGFACPVTTESPVPCPEGTYSVGGADSCSACPPGFSCRAPESAPARCPLGFYSPQNSTVCLRCPAGMECSTPSAVPVDCSPGTFSLLGYPYCYPCPQGMECPSRSQTPVACLAGRYSIGSQSSCTPCPPGYECPSQRAAIVRPCPSGTYSIGNQTRCTPCRRGRFCPSNSDAVDYPCPPGSFSIGAQGECTICPAGFRCPSNDGSQNSPCPPGSFSVFNQSTCTTCPPGYACPFIDRDERVLCPEGTFSIGGQMACSECPAGHACPDRTRNVIIKCELGQYTKGAKNNCTDCPPGFECLNADRYGPSPCGKGFYSVGRQQFCTQCPAGSFCSNTTSPPVACAPGFYSYAGAVKCERCPAGFSCLTPQNPPQPCPAGTWSGNGTTVCLSCSAGYYCPEGSTSPSTPSFACPMGTFCPERSNVPTNCPVGTYGNMTAGRSRAEACVECPPGYFCPQGTGGIFTNLLCPRGRYCPSGTSSQLNCPAGTYNDEFGKTRIEDCKTCPAGFFCPAGTVFPNLCSTRFFCPAGTQSSNQFPCPVGTYNPFPGQDSITKCLICPAGSYCLAAAANPIACPAGRYNPSKGAVALANCLQCTAGWVCPLSGMTRADVPCAQGHFCPTGSSNPTANRCPAGSYTDEFHTIQSSDCKVCPAGYACPLGTGGSLSPWVPCSLGHYCPGAPSPGNSTGFTLGTSSFVSTSSPTQFPCPAGTFGNNTRLRSASECTICPNGTFCNGGQAAPSGPCSAGHFCPEGSSVPNAPQNRCPAGTYSDRTDLFRSDQCIACPPGSYCPIGSISPILCPAGSYSPVNRTRLQGPSSDPDAGACILCPAGSYCPQGSISPLACGRGNFSADGAQDSCSQCPIGRFCASERTSESEMQSSVCRAGVFCPAGTNQKPDFATFACITGHYCPAGTTAPQPCASGSYNPNTGRESQSQCLPCPPGFYCIGGRSNITGTCSSGHYCTGSSSTPTQFSCPPRYYRTHPGGQSEQGCSVCPRGSYCPEASVNPLPCPRGFYCVTGVAVPEPCPMGTYGNSSSLRSEEECTPCTPGFFCDGLGLPNPRGRCDPGYYCLERSFTSAPQVLPFGGLCPAGGFCPVGSSFPAPCPAGTFNNFTGGRDVLDCSPCPPGFYCEGANKPEPTGPCLPGFFCTGGASMPTQHSAQPGFFTRSGAWTQTPCLPGTYNPSVEAASCLICPERSKCPNQGQTTTQLCDAGAFCPPGTSVPLLCPPGTFSNVQGLANASECNSCPLGMYCGSHGLLAPTGLCEAGHYCLLKSPTPAPVSASFGGRCPTGHFCGRGTWNPSKCPIGTFSDVEGLNTSSQCKPCPPGYHCNSTGLSLPAARCFAGYFCTGGSVSPIPSISSMGGICPTGHFCLEGDSSPRPCPEGTFTDTLGASSCKPCLPGFYCPANTTQPLPCPPGRYCPGSTTPNQPQCVVGTFSNRTGLVNVTQCSLCSPGRFCSSPGLSAPNGICSAGYFCVSGAVNGRGEIGLLGGFGDICPPGHFCTGMTSTPSQCKAGTFNPVSGSQNVSACRPCVSGQFCESNALVNPTGPCDAGYYCTGRSKDKRPADGVTGNICPLGHFCPLNSTHPTPCPGGSFSNSTGLQECLPCPSGFYCPVGAKDFKEYDCPAGYVCGPGQESPFALPCPNGTFSAQLNLREVSECTSCTPGMHCSSPALTSPSGPCHAGFYCTIRSKSPEPQDGSGFGGMCRAGYYCPVGSSFEVSCPGGAFCATPGLQRPTGNCSAGYYCTLRSVTPTPLDNVTGNICPVGHYCPSGSIHPLPCPIGRFSNAVGNQNVTQCHICPAGQYCPNSGAAMPAGECSPGFYCPPGQSVSAPPSFSCPIGFICPGGSIEPQRCAPGLYQDDPAQSSCKISPKGFYTKVDDFCPTTNYALPRDCPIGSYCPNGTSLPNQFLCPNGTFGNQTNYFDSSQCHRCSPGSFCLTSGLSKPTGLCDAGYYCVIGARISRPDNDTTGAICPRGFFCPLGSHAPTPCPKGKFSFNQGNTREEDCVACPPGRFCDSVGQSVGSSGLCDPGFICTGGSFLSRPFNFTFGRICRPGFYCPQGSFAEKLCPNGTYNPNEGAATCIDCPPGFYCPSPGLSMYLDCPPGMFCPGNTSVPLLCPISTFSPHIRLVNDSQCLPCSTGMYCGDSGLVHPTGNCSAGHYCQRGSDIPAPLGSFPGNSICPLGHWCASGTLSPTPCNARTFNNRTGADEPSDCLPCPPGMFCGSNGLVNPSGRCSAGFYCPPSQLVPNPIEYRCPRGHFCVEGSAAPLGCPDGSYQDKLQQSTCKTCEAGFFCHTNATLPRLCPASKYCPAGTTYPLTCPNGTYSTSTGLQHVSQCLPCPPGLFCQLGSIVRNCSAGYVCRFGNALPSPPFDARVNVQGGECPPGFYCPSGTSVPLPCLNGTFNPFTRGDQPLSCGPCPAGYQCEAGNPVPFPCSPGYYCPLQRDPQPCRTGTYNPRSFSTNSSACIACPPGFFCPISGLPDFRSFNCPLGHFCPVGSIQPLPCPSGTFRNTTNGATQGDCSPCIGGSFCGNASSTPTLCPPGFHCPRGDPRSPISCRGGTYCPEGSNAEIICSPGRYCPPRSSTEIPCPRGTYCIAGSDEPTLCPAGRHQPESIQTQDRVSLITACLVCPAGFAGDHPLRYSCSPCEAGYVCLSGATSTTPVRRDLQNGYVCPIGNFCPPASPTETPCPVGSFGQRSQLTHENNCSLCPENSYNDQRGQTACLPCGSSAYAPINSTTCICNGTNRVFQKSDGACICKPGFVFYDESQRISERDSPVGCVPIVYDRCLSGEARNSNGDCVPNSPAACTRICPEGGSFDSTLGVCQCSSVRNVDAICDASCRSATTSVHIASSGISLHSPNGSVLTTFPLTSLGSGRIACPSGRDCSARFLFGYSRGFRGLYNVTSEYFSRLFEGSRGSPTILPSSASENVLSDVHTMPSMHFPHRQLLQSVGTNAPNFELGVDQPILCLENGQSVVWDVSDPSRSHYPVYIKDSLFNSNPSFDYGSFRTLASLMTSNVSLRTFAHTFTEPGSYVFADNNNRLRQTVIRVMAPSERCPTNAPILPQTSQNLVSVGSGQSSSLNESPDYILIGVILVGLAVLVAGIILGLYYFRLRRWGDGVSGEAAYRMLGHNYTLEMYGKEFSEEREKRKQVSFGVMRGSAGGVDSSDGALVSSSNAAGSSMATRFAQDKILLEDFNVRTLFDKLQDQTILVMSQLRDHETSAKYIYEQIAAETFKMKQLLEQQKEAENAQLLTQGDLPDNVSLDDVRRELDSEIQHRENFGKEFDHLANKISRLMEEAQGAAGMSSGFPEEELRRLEEAIDSLESESDHLRRSCQHESNRRHSMEGPLKSILGEKLSNMLKKNDPQDTRERSSMLDEYQELIRVLRALFDRMKSSRSRIDSSGSSKDRQSAQEVEMRAKDMREILRDKALSLNRLQNVHRETKHESSQDCQRASDQLAALEKKLKPAEEMKLSEESLEMLAKQIEKIMGRMLQQDALRQYRQGGVHGGGDQFHPFGGAFGHSLDDEEEIARLFAIAQANQGDMRAQIELERARQRQKVKDQISQRRQRRLDRQEEEHRKLEEEMSNLEDEERRRLEEKLEDDMKFEVSALDDFYHRERRRILAQGENTEEELARLKNIVEANKLHLQDRLRDEANRQREKLEERLAKRRNKRHSALVQAHADEDREEEEAAQDDLDRIDDIFTNFAGDTDVLKRRLAEEMRRQQESLKARLAAKSHKLRLMEEMEQAIEAELLEEEEHDNLRDLETLNDEKQQLLSDQLTKSVLQQGLESGLSDDVAKEFQRISEEFETKRMAERNRIDQEMDLKRASLHKRLADKRLALEAERLFSLDEAEAESRRQLQEEEEIADQERSALIENLRQEEHVRVEELLQRNADAALIDRVKQEFEERCNAAQVDIDRRKDHAKLRAKELFEKKKRDIANRMTEREAQFRQEEEEQKRVLEASLAEEKRLAEEESERSLLKQRREEERLLLERTRDEEDKKILRRLTEDFEVRRFQLSDHIQQMREQKMANMKQRMEKKRRERERSLAARAKERALDDNAAKLEELDGAIVSMEVDEQQLAMHSEVERLRQLLEAQEKRNCELEARESAMRVEYEAQIDTLMKSKEEEERSRMETSERERIAELKVQEEDLRRREQAELESAKNDEERARIRENFERERQLRSDIASKQRDAQKAAFERKMRKLQEEKERKRIAFQQEEKMRLLEQEENELDAVNDESSRDDIVIQDNLADLGEDVSIRVRAIEESQEESRRRLEERYRLELQEDLARLAQQAAIEEAREREEIERRELDRQRRLQEELEMQEQQRKEEAANETMRTKIQSEFDERRSAMADQMKKQREIELERLRAKQDVKRRQRELELRRAKEEEIAEQHRREDTQKQQEIANMEGEALEEAISRGDIPEDMKRSAVEMILRKKHVRDYEDLIKRQENEVGKFVTLEVEQARVLFDSSLAEKRLQQKEIESSLAALRDESVLQHQRMIHAAELSAVEGEFEEERREIEHSSRQALRLKHMEERATLKRGQLQELAQVCDDMSPEIQLLREQEAERKKAKEEIEAMKANLVAEREAELERQRVEYESEMERVRREMYKRIEEEEEKKRLELEELERRHREEEEERVRMLREFEEYEDTKDKILSEGEREINTFRDRIRVEFESQRQKFIQRIRKESEKKRRLADAKMREQMKAREESELRRREEEERRRKEMEMQRNAAAAADRLKRSLSRASSSRAPSLSGQSFGAIDISGDVKTVYVPQHNVLQNMFQGLNVSPQDRRFMELLMESEFYSKLLQIESLVLTLQDKNNKFTQSGPFCDPRDRDLLRKGILERVLPEELNVSELICYKFGTIVLSVLFENDAPKLGVASNLPNVDYVGNAFRNSIHYDRTSRFLFIRRERLDSPGDLALILAHASAHIFCNDNMHNDTSSEFLNRFYNNLRRLLQECFRKFARPSPSSEMIHRVAELAEFDDRIRVASEVIPENFVPPYASANSSVSALLSSLESL